MRLVRQVAARRQEGGFGKQLDVVVWWYLGDNSGACMVYVD